MIEINSCPICSSTEFVSVFSCQDYTVSHETFQIKQCSKCNLLITSPRPNDKILPRYYQSNDYISHTGKANSFINWLYLQARKITLKGKLNLLAKYSKSNSKQVLDYGCGTGDFLTICKSAGYICNGVEPSAAREKANQLLPDSIFESINQLPKNAKFGVITLWHVLEHITDLEQTFQQICESLGQDGTIFIAVPNFESYDAKVYKEHWAAYDTPRHVWHFNKNAMETFANKFGLKIKHILPMKLDSYYVSMLSEKYMNDKLNLLGYIKAIIIGTISNLKATKKTNYSSLIYVLQK